MPQLLEDPFILAYCVGTFLVAGTIKGVLGIGLPATAMALLTLVMDPTEAVATVSMPIIATNVQQFFSTPHRMHTARTYAPMAIALFVTIFFTALLITRFPEALLVAAIGIVMCIFAVHALSGFRLPVGEGTAWQTGVGVIAGICGGLSAIWAPPIAMYLISRNVLKDHFVSACGFLFMVGSLPLATGLTLSGVLDGNTLALSLVSLAAAMAAFRIGAMLRSRLQNETFRKLVLVTFLVMGARLVWTGVSG